VDYDNLTGKTILLTGGTGSFGNEFVKKFGKHNQIIIYSRDEMKQWVMQNAFNSSYNLKFVMGDVRDRTRITSEMRGVDVVVHAAATKIVPLAEINPSECLKTNVLGAENVIHAAAETGVKKVIALSTDKASSPINFYGAAKLLSDKLFINAAFGVLSNAQVNVVRYGNVIGSRGSVIPFFISQAKKNGFVTVTDPKMTRFMIRLDEAVAMVRDVIKSDHTGCIFVKKIPSMTLHDIATSIVDETQIKIIGHRAGEKVHEQMIGLEDAPYTYENDDYFIIKSYEDIHKDRAETLKKVGPNFRYSSEVNHEWMDKTALRELIENGYFDELT
jgi:FlaA1/EpsC-like NDP-sugar epimerase